MSNKKKYEKKSFESDQSSSDVMAMFFASMRFSSAFEKLSSVAQNVYRDMKLEYYRQKKKPFPEDRTCFYFNKYIWKNIYHYKNANQISKCINELILLGFIRCKQDGYTNRTKSIYQYSDKWRNYGTDKFRIEPQEMTISLQRQQKEIMVW
jgi:hypothetical protein